MPSSKNSLGEEDTAQACDTNGLPAVGNVCDSTSGFRTIVETIPLAIVVYQVRERVVHYANQALDRLYGLKPGELIGLDASFLIPRLPDRRMLERKLANGVVIDDVDIRARRADNDQWFWVSVWMRRVQCDQKECILSIMSDVTKRKERESIHNEHQEMLETLLKISKHDRQLIAYDIHDGVVQDMTGALMHLEAASKSLSSRKAATASLLDTARRLLRDGIKEARRLIDGVRPPDIEQGGLEAALRTLAAKIGDTTGIEVEVAANGDFSKLPLPLASDLFRIIQEALNNVWRHSKSTVARVALSKEEREITISVTDWGVGFDPQAVHGEHLGLTGIRERSQVLGGTVSIESQPNEGSTITVKIPVRDASVFDPLI